MQYYMFQTNSHVCTHRCFLTIGNHILSCAYFGEKPTTTNEH